MPWRARNSCEKCCSLFYFRLVIARVYLDNLHSTTLYITNFHTDLKPQVNISHDVNSRACTLYIIMDVGRPPRWILQYEGKKGCFFSFEWEKTNFTTFAPLEKFLKNLLVAPLEKILPTPMYTTMSVWRGVAGTLDPSLDFETCYFPIIFSKKDCFLSFRVEKWKFYHFWSPQEKFTM